MFNITFLSPQLKRCAIITYKHGMYELSNKLPKSNFANTSKKEIKPFQ